MPSELVRRFSPAAARFERSEFDTSNTHTHTHSLIAKWKKTGYEKLCCARCIQSRVSCLSHCLSPARRPDDATYEQQDMNYAGSTCICRVPKAQLREGTVVGSFSFPSLSLSRQPNTRLTLRVG